MSDPSLPEVPASLDPRPEDRLDSWKEIAAYLRRDVTTVQRWEKREAMPVHRHVHDKKGSVYAFRAELDEWARTRNLAPAESVDSPAGHIEPSRSLGEGERARVAIASDASPSPRAERRRLTLVLALTAGTVLLAAGGAWWRLERTGYFWRNPFDDARFRYVTDFGGTENAAAISRDGRLVAFLSDRDGPMDVWVTQVGTGQFYNLTRGRMRELVNPQVRGLNFSPDGSVVTFWTRRTDGSPDRNIAVWAVPTLGGEPRPYLEGVAEFDWSSDGSQLVYHTPAPGDPMFVRKAGTPAQGEPIFAAAAGLHAHFPLWSPDAKVIYFVQGSLPDAMDVWRIPPGGGAPERITHHDAQVSHPVLLDPRTLVYLASDRDGSGPWLHAIDVEHRVPHRVAGGVNRYTSLGGSADGRHLVATLAKPTGTLWRLQVDNAMTDGGAASPIALTTGRGFAPRLGRNYLLYVSSKGASDGIWKLEAGAATELWSATDARIIGGPEISPDGARVAFSVGQPGKTVLFSMNVDGTNARVVTESLQLHGAPVWSPDGQSITTAANVDGTPHLVRISPDGSAVQLVEEYSTDPVWSPHGDFLVYSGADVGTTFPVKAVTATGRSHPVPKLTLTRGARRLRFFPGRPELLAMRGDIQHKDLWLIDLSTGAERQLTNVPPDFNFREFDISPDGREIVLERVQEQSDVVLIELARRD